MLKNVVVGLVICAATVLGSTRPVGAADRFEVTSIKAVVRRSSTPSTPCRRTT